MTYAEQQQLVNRLAVDKERQREEGTINFDDSMWEKEHNGPQVDFRSSRATETKFKTGDYVLPSTIEEEMERENSQKYNDNFPEKQRQYEMERQARLLNLQTDAMLEESENNQQRVMCEGSRKIMQGKRRGNIHERLYRQGLIKQEQQVAQALTGDELEELGLVDDPKKNSASQSHVPTITQKSKELKREGTIEDRLLYDAKMRNVRRKRLQKSDDLQLKRQRSPKTAGKSRQYCFMKFLKEYALVLDRLGIDEGSELNMLQYGNLLTDLRMISDNGTNDDLLFEAWKAVCPQDQQTVNEQEVQNFVTNVYKTTEGQRIADIRNRQVLKDLAMNRVTLSAIDKKAHRIKDDSSILDSEVNSDIHPTFKPTISMNSQTIDIRKKVRSGLNGIPRHEILLKKGAEYQQKQRKKIRKQHKSEDRSVRKANQRLQRAPIMTNRKQITNKGSHDRTKLNKKEADKY